MRKINLKRAITLLAIVLLVATLSNLYGRAEATSSTASEGQAAVHALFDLATTNGGPFPTNWFSVPDRSNNTNLRVNLPKPDCSARPSDCEDIDVLNTLDGFNMQPRLSIPFDGLIDVNSVTSETVFLIKLLPRDDDGDDDGDGDRLRPETVGVNRIVWDTFTHTLHVWAEQILEQHTRYALIVTRGVRDSSGRPVDATQEFRRFRQTVDGPYKQALLHAVQDVRRLGIREEQIAVASVFSTQSATAVLEQIRDQIKAGTPEPANFNLGPGGTRTVFSRREVTGITYNRQISVSGALSPVGLTLGTLDLYGNGVVGTIAFGSYHSPDYMVHPGEIIPAVGTRTGSPRVQGNNEIYFDLYLPAGPRPANGWPVAIVGHGRGGTKIVNLGVQYPWNLTSMNAANGVATICINHVGHGYGPRGTLAVRQADGTSVTLSAGGRAIDQNNDGVFGDFEGAEPSAPNILQGVRDGYIQTIADLMQLIRVVQVGVDVDGDGSRDLDPSRIFCNGQSQGAITGVVLTAVEPDIRAAVMTSAGGPVVDNRRSVLGSREILARHFAARQPSILNGPGITRIAGVTVPTGPFFNENIPLRDGVPLTVGLQDGTTQVIRSPVINTVAGAMALQEWFDRAGWAGQASNPVAFARHLRRDPLPGVSPRPVLFQNARGDRAIDNQLTTNMLRTGDLADRWTLFRLDIFCAENPMCAKNGHGFMVNYTNYGAVSTGAVTQIARFFASDGTEVVHPEPARFFEVPIVPPLPEDPGYIP